VREDAKDKSGNSRAHGGGKGKVKACAGGAGDDNNNLCWNSRGLSGARGNSYVCRTTTGQVDSCKRVGNQ
jgi:hypothetical protein